MGFGLSGVMPSGVLPWIRKIQTVIKCTHSLSQKKQPKVETCEQVYGPSDKPVSIGNENSIYMFNRLLLEYGSKDLTKRTTGT